MTTKAESKAGERTHENIDPVFGFLNDLTGVSLHWSEDQRELTIKSSGKIGLPFGDKIRALIASSKQSPAVIAAASELLEALEFIALNAESANVYDNVFRAKAAEVARAAIAKAEGKSVRK